MGGFLRLYFLQYAWIGLQLLCAVITNQAGKGSKEKERKEKKTPSFGVGDE